MTLPTAAGGYISFSAGGQSLVYVRESSAFTLREFQFDSMAARWEGWSREVLEGASVVTNPHLSPDGSFFVVDSIGAIQEDLFLVERFQGRIRRLTNDAFKDRAPRWHPDGRKILFFSDRSGRYELWTIGRDGKDLRQVSDTQGGAGVQTSLWTRDGNSILASFQWGPPAFLRSDSLRTKPLPLSPDTFQVPGFLAWYWDPEGERVAGWREGIYVYDFLQSSTRKVCPPSGSGRSGFPTDAGFSSSKKSASI